MAKLQTPIALIILDGFGLGNPADASNAIALSDTKHLTLLSEMYPHTTLTCSGEAVGLPEGQMGNSEVGHLNIGAGRIVYQELTRISKDIREGGFFRNPVLNQVMSQVAQQKSALHLMGLLSDGGVHSHNTHLYALLTMAKQAGLEQVYVHAYLDGRDVPPSSAAGFLQELEDKIAELGIGRIATISGRYYAMDRDKRWERVEKAYAALVYGEGEHAASSAAAIQAAYDRGETDEFVLPTVIDGCGDCGMKSGDGVIFFNFRPDRARQLTRVFVDETFAGFTKREGFIPLHYVTMTQYEDGLPVEVAYKPAVLNNTLGEVISKAGLHQLRIAETEKYAHVTYFFNGGEETPFPHEQRILIPSPKVATYDLQPTMSAAAVTDKMIEEIRSGKHDVLVLNFANCDMVGHTGQLTAACQAVATVDACVGRVVEAMRDRGGIVLITADHGNAELMVDPSTGQPHTAHTTNPVPFILVSEAYRYARLQPGNLADIAPTILDLACLPIPDEMTGRSLLIK